MSSFIKDCIEYNKLEYIKKERELLCLKDLWYAAYYSNNEVFQFVFNHLKNKLIPANLDKSDLIDLFMQTIHSESFSLTKSITICKYINKYQKEYNCFDIFSIFARISARENKNELLLYLITNFNYLPERLDKGTLNKINLLKNLNSFD